MRNAEVLVGMGMLRQRAAQLAARCTSGAATRSSGSAMHRRRSPPVGAAAAAGVQVAMLGLGAWLVVAGDASPGIMVAATVLIGRALQPVEHLIAGWKSLVEVRGGVAASRTSSRSTRRGQRPLRLPPPRGELSLERVSLVADPTRAPLIKGVSLQLAPANASGLIGPSASGKTTLVRLMLGLRAPHAGSVRLDGADLAAGRASSSPAPVGYLPQDVELFDGSVAHNIAAARRRVRLAAR